MQIIQRSYRLPEAYLEPSRTSTMEPFAKIVAAVNYFRIKAPL